MPKAPKTISSNFISMDAEEYRHVLVACGFDQEMVGHYLGFSPRMSRRYATGQWTAPQPIATLLRVMAHCHVTKTQILSLNFANGALGPVKRDPAWLAAFNAKQTAKQTRKPARPKDEGHKRWEARNRSGADDSELEASSPETAAWMRRRERVKAPDEPVESEAAPEAAPEPADHDGD